VFVCLALAGWLSLSVLRLRRGRCGASPSSLAVPRLRAPDVADCGDGDAQDATAAGGLVLGGLPGRDAWAWDLGLAAAAPARSDSLGDGGDAAAQAAPGDGRAGARAAQWRGRSRRGLSRRARSGFAREPPARWQAACRRRRRGPRQRLRPSAAAAPDRRLG